MEQWNTVDENEAITSARHNLSQKITAALLASGFFNTQVSYLTRLQNTD